MKIKLIICICILTPLFSVGQEQDSWWQTDGSLKLEHAEHTFTTPIVKSKKSVKEDEMLLINLNNYRGEDQADINYGIYSKDLNSEEFTELKVYHRKKISSSNANIAPNFGFDFTNDNYLIYGCKTSTNTLPSFTNQEYSWDAYGYYAHGYNFRKTQIKSTDYKHLWNRPESADWWDTTFYIGIAVVVIIVIVIVSIVTFGGGDVLIAGIGNISTSVGVGTATKIFAGLAVSSIIATSYLSQNSSLYHSLDSAEQELHLIPQKEFETDMELPIPHKFEHPENDAQKKWNKSIDTYAKHSFDCTNLPGKKCFKAPFKEVVAKIMMKNSHVKHVNIPGAIHKDITPYQLFKNYQYVTDQEGSIFVSAVPQKDIKDASEIFNRKDQILPRKLLQVPHELTTFISLQSFKGVPTYYIVSKDIPDMNNMFYSDLGVYGEKDGHEYKLYRFQTKENIEPFNFTTGPDGPFLAGDNIVIEEERDLSVRIFRTDDVNPVEEKIYSFLDGDRPQINFHPGDSVVFTSSHSNFTIEGVPEIWLARASGESKYYCSPNIRPNEYKPFLGYDSQVHGVAVRAHPNPNKKKTPEITYDSETNLYSWYWIAQRRMDPNIQDNTQLTNQNVIFEKYKTAQHLGNNGFPIGAGIKVQKQRNNQREGYNMQLLYAWKKAGESEPVFEEYGGPRFILGTDPDEIVYLGCNGAKVPSADTPIPQALLKIDTEEWKRLPEGENSDPINEMVTAYQTNRNYIDGNNAVLASYEGYEILDKSMYREHNITGVSNTKPCNGKPCVKFFQDGIGEEDDNNKAPGAFHFMLDRETQMQIDVSLDSPQSKDSGFYGSIEGDQWPSEWQKNVPYSFTGLSDLPTEVLNTLVMEYSHENELGILTKDTRYYRDNGVVNEDGKWTEFFDLKGWGYNEITVYAQRKPNATMVPIAGMELLEVMMRFLSVPGSKWNDFSPTPFDGVDLKEGRGEGNYWYLRDSNNDLSNHQIYGNPLDDINKSYTFSVGERVIFNPMDSDPHTFFHYDVEWYLSERFMAKRLLPNDLEYRIQWFIAPSYAEGLGEFIHKGRWLDKTFDTPGKYRLTAVYGENFNKNDDRYNHTRMSHEITIMPDEYSTDVDINKAQINIYSISPDQITWLKEKYPEINTSWRVAELDDIYSKWTHIDGPRAEPPNEKPNRYGLENDYNAHFDWYDSSLSSETTSLTPYTNYTIDDPNLDWFPSYWIRHFSGNNLPNDIDISVVPGGSITSTPDDIDNALHSAFPLDTPEPWQWRLPWVSITNWQGYRTRANIKVVFNMEKLFDNQIGAFAGVGNSHMTNNNYIASVSNPIPGLTDQNKSKYDFYLDLLSDRKIIYDPSIIDPSKLNVHQVDDVADSNSITLVNAANTTNSSPFLKGADMSIVKNLEDEGITWLKDGTQTDPYEIISSAGANTVRLRLWVNPKMANGSPYNYSNLTSVTNEILRAKEKNLQIILCLHYSDTWTDPKQNIIPDAWKLNLGDSPNHHSTTNDDFPSVERLGQKITEYTNSVLQHLEDQNALPNIVQIGNEINGNLLMSKPYADLSIDEIAAEIGVNVDLMNGNKYTINWDRNAYLINVGLSAVNNFSSEIKTMLHLAGPVFAQYWLSKAFNSEDSQAATTERRLGTAIVDREKIDLIGLSYYPGEIDQQQTIPNVKQIIENIGALYNKDVLLVEIAFPRSYGYSDNTTNLYSDLTRGAWPENTGSSEQLEWLVTLKETLITTQHSVGFIYWEPFWVGSNTAQTKDFVGSNWENLSFFNFQNGMATDANELDLNGGINVFSSGTDSRGQSYRLGNIINPPIPAELPNNPSPLFDVYPNPVSNKLTIVFPNHEKNRIELIDVQGRVLYSEMITNSNKHVVHTKKLQLKTGVLIIRVTSENGTSHIKKVILK